MRKKYWNIVLAVADNPLYGVSPAAVERSETGLSAHVRVASSAQIAMLDSEDLALAYLDCVRPVLNRRYGKDGWAARVVACESTEKWAERRIEKDSAIVRARIETGNFAPNRKVEVAKKKTTSTRK